MLRIRIAQSSFLFFFNDTATTEIYTLSLHDALPILASSLGSLGGGRLHVHESSVSHLQQPFDHRSEEHTSELQSRLHLVCRLLLEKKKMTASFPHSARATSEISFSSRSRLSTISTRT